MTQAQRDDVERARFETYCLGLLTEEAGEVCQLTGKALRFGIDTPSSAGADAYTARSKLHEELGDLLAAIEFAKLHGMVDGGQINAARDRKLGKLTNPASRDNLGRQLAPIPALRSAEAPAPSREVVWELKDSLDGPYLSATLCGLWIGQVRQADPHWCWGVTAWPDDPRVFSGYAPTEALAKAEVERRAREFLAKFGLGSAEAPAPAWKPDREAVARALFESRPNNNWNRRTGEQVVPAWDKQPDHIKTSFYRDADAILALPASPPSTAQASVPEELRAIDEIAAERRRQAEVEGWSAKHDDQHTDESLACAAAAYALPAGMVHSESRTYDAATRGDCPVWHTVIVPYIWPESWHPTWWKPKDRRRDLIRAAALIVAEIERLDRAALKDGAS